MLLKGDKQLTLFDVLDDAKAADIFRLDECPVQSFRAQTLFERAQLHSQRWRADIENNGESIRQLD